MLFHDFVFLYFFLPVVLLAFYASTTLAIRFSVLALSSLVFYAAEKPVYVLLLVASIAANYFIANKICENRSKFYLVTALVFNLGLLCYFKYYNFFIDQVDGVIGHGFNLDIVLPIGISFYTFQQIAYQIDIYRGESAYRDIIKYTVFVTFFPQLIAGPIVHHREMMPQFEYLKKFSTNNFCVGIFLLAIGLAKKVVIADSIATFSTPVFLAAEAGSISTSAAWSGALAYTMQIYFDFSGYSDMALGLARLFGIRLPLNFNMPYRSTSIIEFWRRWHITLSRFLRDYLYISLGGSRLGAPRRWFNLMATMLLGGLWHGAAWTYVAWGGLHGILLVINHVWNSWHPERLLAETPRWQSLLAWTLTFLAIVHSWVFFRADSFPGAMNMLSAMWGGQTGPQNAIGNVDAAPLIKFFLLSDELAQVNYNSYVTTYFAPLFLLSLFLSTRKTNTLTLGRQLAISLQRNTALSNTALALAVIVTFYLVGILTSYGASEFLYYQF